jgi:hypothetical protein
MASVTVTKTVDIPDGVLKDILITAFEGGINYWCNSARTISGEGCYEAFDADRYVILHEFDGDEHLLNKKKVLNGIVKFCEFRKVAVEAFASDDWYDIINLDAEVADIIVQFGLFDDIIYG